MWLLSPYNCLRLKVTNFNYPALLYYTDVFTYILAPWAYKRKGPFVYVNKICNKAVERLTLETRNVRFKYVGKAYRISKKKKILLLNMHYPTFKYVIWSNIKLYHKKKKRKVFKFKALTSSRLTINFFQNMFKLRVPDTYTKRGILNNMFVYQNRKQRAATHR